MTEIDVCRGALRELAIDRLAGREVRTSHLVEAGLDAIVAGLDAPSLALLAGLEASEGDAVDKALDQVVDELGLELPADATAARWLLIHGWLTAMVKGDLSPAAGGALVGEVAALLGSPQALRGITRWSAMLDNWIPTDLTPRDVCEVPILEESAELLEGPWPPRPRHP
ncbi:hypothetical protein [Amycolatopsis pittospori]|uniref:hypothetical protein n=1 Tax=Amycolatopsis pittospori TaxID=2749434 RepID=UPI0015F0CFF1|nr:hypothetical protein [Amycolatopsis pittospori]